MSNSKPPVYDAHVKRSVSVWILNHLDQICSNATGVAVRFAPVPSLHSTIPALSSGFINLPNLNTIPAQFYDRWCTTQIRNSFIDCTPSVLSRDASHDAEYEQAHRTLIIPMSKQNPHENKFDDVKYRFYTFLVLPEHGVHIQYNRVWLPANVIILTPLAYTYPVDEKVTTMIVQSLGVITSPHTTLAHSMFPIGERERGCPVFFGSVETYLTMYAGPRNDACVKSRARTVELNDEKDDDDATETDLQYAETIGVTPDKPIAANRKRARQDE